MSESNTPLSSNDPPRKPLRVGADSNPKDVAGAIANTVRSDGAVDVHAIGAQAVNQAVKAVIIAIDFLQQRGEVKISVTPSFIKLDVGAGQKTAICFAIDRQS
jgi:stage V sporulation protein S